jgi:hypothetical protein
MEDELSDLANGIAHFRMTTATIWLLAPHFTEADISPWIRTRSGSFVDFHAIRYTSEIKFSRAPAIDHQRPVFDVNRLICRQTGSLKLCKAIRGYDRFS